MKRSILISLILFVSVISTIKAQITINRQDFPEIGYLVVRAVDDVTAIDPGQAGPDQVWDFSNLVPVNVDSTYYLSPVGLPGYQDYLQANIASNHNPNSYPNGGYNVNFWNVSDQNLNGVGDESLVNLFGSFYMAFHIGYIPPASEIAFPFTYGNTNNQDFIMELVTAIRNEGITTDSSIVRCHINIDCLADAYGTMNLPDGSFPVLRVRETWNSFDTSYVWESGAWVYDSDTTSSWTQYRWYANDFGEVGIYRSGAAKGNGFTFFKSETLVGLDEHMSEAEFAVYPNPASDQIKIISQAPFEKIEILDNTGRSVMLSENHATLDVSALAPGLYIIRVFSGNVTGSGRLLIQ